MRARDTEHLDILVQLEGTSSTEATWGIMRRCLQSTPDAHLEEKMESLAAGIVITTVKERKLITYQSKNYRQKNIMFLSSVSVLGFSVHNIPLSRLEHESIFSFKYHKV